MCIGQADCQFVVTRDSKNKICSLVMIDAGRSGDAQEIHNYMETNFPDEALTALVITHWDGDHWFGLKNKGYGSQIISSERITSKTKVYYPDVLTDRPNNPVSEDLVNIRKQLQKNKCSDYKNLKLYSGEGHEVYLSFVTHKEGPKQLSRWYDEPAAAFTTLKNESSIGTLFVIVEKGKKKSGERLFSYFTAGDLTKNKEDGLMGGTPFHLDVLKISHHGSTSSSGDEYLHYLQPKTCIITCNDVKSSSKKKIHHPDKKVLDGINKINSKPRVICASKNGIVPVSLIEYSDINKDIYTTQLVAPGSVEEEDESCDLKKRHRTLEHTDKTHSNDKHKIGFNKQNKIKNGYLNSDDEINSVFANQMLEHCGLILKVEEQQKKKIYSFNKENENDFELLNFKFNNFKIIEESLNDGGVSRSISGGISFKDIKSDIDGYMLNNSMGFVLVPKEMSFNNILKHFKLDVEIPKLGDVFLSYLSCNLIVNSKNKIDLNTMGVGFTYKFADGLDLSCNFMYFYTISDWAINVNLHSNLSVHNVLQKLGVDDKYINKMKFIKDLIIQDFGIDIAGETKKIHMSLSYSNNSEGSVSLTDNVEMIFKEGIELNIEYADAGEINFSLNINAGIKISSTANEYADAIVQCEYSRVGGLTFDIEVNDIVVDFNDFEVDNLRDFIGSSANDLRVGHARIKYTDYALMQFNDVTFPFEVMDNQLQIVSFELSKKNKAWEFSSTVKMTGFTIDVQVSKKAFFLKLNNISFYHLTKFLYQSETMKNNDFTFEIKQLIIEIDKKEGTFKAQCNLPEVSLYGGNLRFKDIDLLLEKRAKEVNFSLRCGLDHPPADYTTGIIISKNIFDTEEDIIFNSTITIGSKGLDFEATYRGRITNKEMNLVILNPGIKFTLGTGVGIGLTGNIQANDFVGNALIYCNDLTKPQPFIAFNFNGISIKKLLNTYIFTEESYNISAIPDISLHPYLLKESIVNVSDSPEDKNYLLTLINQDAEDKVVRELIFDKKEKSKKYFAEYKLYMMYEYDKGCIYEYNHFYFNSNVLPQKIFGVEYHRGIALSACIKLFDIDLFVKFQAIKNQNLTLAVCLKDPINLFNNQLIISESLKSGGANGPYLNLKATQSDFNFQISGRISLFSGLLSADLFLSINESKYKFHAELQFLGILHVILDIEADRSNFKNSNPDIYLLVETASFVPLIQSVREEVRNIINDAAGDGVKKIKKLKAEIKEYANDTYNIERDIDNLYSRISALNRQQFSWYQIWESASREAEVLFNYGLIGVNYSKIGALKLLMVTAIGLLEVAELAIEASAAVLGVLTDSIFNILEMIAQSIEYIFKLNTLEFNRTLGCEVDEENKNQFEFAINFDCIGATREFNGLIDLSKGIDGFKEALIEGIRKELAQKVCMTSYIGHAENSEVEEEISMDDLICLKDEMNKSITVAKKDQKNQFVPDSSTIISSLEELRGLPNYYTNSASTTNIMDSFQLLSNLNGAVSAAERDVDELINNSDELDRLVNNAKDAIEEYKKESVKLAGAFDSDSDLKKAKALKKALIKEADKCFKAYKSNKSVLNELAPSKKVLKSTNRPVSKLRSASLLWRGNLDESPKDLSAQLSELKVFYWELVEKDVDPVLLASVALAIGGIIKESDLRNAEKNSKIYFRKALKHYSLVYKKRSDQYKEFASKAK